MPPPTRFVHQPMALPGPAHAVRQRPGAEPEGTTMKTLSAIVLGLAMLGLVGLARADEKKKDDAQKKDDNATKLLGTWEITKSTGNIPEGTTIEFTKDGKFVLTMNDMKVEGTYSVEKDKLITKIGDASDNDTIKKLTADAMELENKDGVALTLKKKK